MWLKAQDIQHVALVPINDLESNANEDPYYNSSHCFRNDVKGRHLMIHIEQERSQEGNEQKQ